MSDVRKLKHKFRKTFILIHLKEPKQLPNIKLEWSTEGVVIRQLNINKHLLEDGGILTG